MEPETRTCNDLDIHSCELKACLREVRERSGWDEKRGRLPPGRGIGVGCGGFVSGAGYPIYRSEFPHSNAIIKVEDDGSKAVLFTGEADIGQGSDTVLGQIAAEAMGISFDRVEVISADSDITPLGLGAYSSRVTLMGGNAARMAGEEVKLQVVSAAAKMLDMPASELEAKDNMILAREQPDKSIGWREAAAAYFSEAGPLLGKGHYSPPQDLGGKYKGAAVGTSPAFSFSAAVCEVEVDMETGKVRVLNFWDAHDCGTAINPMAVEGQVEGAAVMGMSETLLEQEEFDERGRSAQPRSAQLPAGDLDGHSDHRVLDRRELRARRSVRGERGGGGGRRCRCWEPSPTPWPTPSGPESLNCPSRPRRYCRRSNGADRQAKDQQHRIYRRASGERRPRPQTGSCEAPATSFRVLETSSPEEASAKAGREVSWSSRELDHLWSPRSV